MELETMTALELAKKIRQRQVKVADGVREVFDQIEKKEGKVHAYLDIYKKSNDWAFKHLVDPDYPEWFGYLHRDGSVAQPAKGNLFKGPFHIPRMLVLCHLLSNQIIIHN